MVMQDWGPWARRAAARRAQRAKPLSATQEALVLGAVFALGVMLQVVMVLRLSAIIE